MTIEEFMKFPSREYGQFYGSYKRKKDKSVKEKADEFLKSLEEDIAMELSARGFDIDRESIWSECESIRPNIERLVKAYEEGEDLDESLKEVFTEKHGFEWYIQSRNGLLSTRACEIFDDDPEELHIEFND